MSDPGFISGFIGVGIDNAIQQVLHHINIASRCKKELACLKDLVIKIVPIIKEIQQYRQAINRKKKDKASAINEWLKEMDGLLHQASDIAQRCTIPMYTVISRYQASMRITGLISDINEHLKLSPLVELAQMPELLEGQTQKLQEEIGQIKESIEAMASSSTSQAVVAPTGSAKMKLIDEPLIVGQHKAFAGVEKLLIDDDEANKNIGVLGKGGSGKTLLLKTVFNSEKVRNHFRDGLLLWLTVSQTPSVTSLRNELCTQIAIQKNVDFVKIVNEEDVKIWLNEALRHIQRFALFLDDVWGGNVGNLFEDLGILQRVRDRSNSNNFKVIVSSRDRSALLKMGVADEDTIKMGDLNVDESWRLFAYHAFPYNNGNLPRNIDEEKAKLVSRKCGGLPLAIKVVGRAMAGKTYQQQWEWALHSLPNADSVYDCLRLSYDALGNEEVNMQLCFLYVAANSIEDQIIASRLIIIMWVGEGLLARKMMKDDPFEMGRVYLNLLADRCLIEPTMRDVDGYVDNFKIHDLLRDMAIGIAEEEENFYCRAARDLTALDENECSRRTRIMSSFNKLSSLPQSFRAPQASSLLINVNMNFTKIPERVIGSMISLKVLDLSATSLHSLPESVGCLKRLVYLSLRDSPIQSLPASFTELANLEILDLEGISIKELPLGFHKLRSLRYLSLTGCKDLQYLPRSISKVTSLQELRVNDCPNLWTKLQGKRWKKVASINNLGTLIQLQRLALQNNGRSINEPTLGRLTQMDTLRLRLTNMDTLPNDISNMSRLRKLSLECSHLVKMGSNFCELQNLTCLMLYKCDMLEELPHLQKLRKLKRVEIVWCSKLMKFPKEFGESGAFPMLETFSLMKLEVLEELPRLHEGAMPSFKIFTMMECKALKILPKDYLYLETLEKIRVYGCSIIERNIREITSENTKVQVVTMSLSDIQEAKVRYSLGCTRYEDWYYGEFWYNEFFLFLKSLETILMQRDFLS